MERLTKRYNDITGGGYEPIENNVEAKAKAFDVLKEKLRIGNYCSNDYPYEIRIITQLSLITKEQYEILKKVGVE